MPGAGVMVEGSCLTLVLGPEALVSMVALRHKVQPQPVLVADDGCRDVRPGKPVEENTGRLSRGPGIGGETRITQPQVVATDVNGKWTAFK